MSRLLAVWVGLAACKKDRPAAVGPTSTDDLPDTTSIERAVEVGPGRWSGQGVSLYVPPGWAGQEGPPPRLVTIAHGVTGVTLEMWAYDQPLDGPREAEGEVCDFVGRASFRAVPALGLSDSATCVADDHTRQAWWAVVDGREVHVEVITPLGRAIRGRQDVTPMLRDLALEGSAPGPAPIGATEQREDEGERQE